MIQGAWSEGDLQRDCGLVTSGIGPRSWGYPANSGHVTLGRDLETVSLTPMFMVWRTTLDLQMLTPQGQDLQEIIMKTMHGTPGTGPGRGVIKGL